MLQRDVTEHHVGRRVGQRQRSSVGHVRRGQPFGGAEARHRFTTAFEKRRIQIGGHHRLEASRESGRHPTDAGADFHEAALFILGRIETEELQIRANFLFT